MLIRMVEEWKENLDNNFIAGAVPTDLKPLTAYHTTY